MDSEGGLRHADDKGVLHFLPWPDYQPIGMPLYAEWLDIALRALAAGKSVEVACHAGHGRTGTYIAGADLETGGPRRPGCPQSRPEPILWEGS